MKISHIHKQGQKTFIALFTGLIFLASACGKKGAPLSKKPVPVTEKKESLPPTAVLIPKLSATFIDNIRFKQFPPSRIISAGNYEDSTNFRIEKIHYLSNGLRINGLMGIPATPPPYPAVLICHGYYPPKDYFQGQGTRSTIEGLAREGFLVLVTDYRGYGGSDGRHQNDLPGEVYDVIEAFKALRARPDVQKDKIFLLGYSWGGGFAATAAEALPMAAGLINYYGQLRGLHIDPRLAAFYRSHGASNEEIQYIFKKQSPITHAKYIQFPVLLLHGEKDHTVRPEQSRAFYNALKEAGKDVELKMYPEYSHAFGDNYDNHATPALIEFLKKHTSG